MDARFPRRLSIPIVLAAIALAACTASTATPPAQSPSSGSVQKGAPPVVGPAEPVALDGRGGNAASGTGTSGSAGIAYPLPGMPAAAVAPAKTIVAVGTGHAEARADGSDRAAAQQKATGDAIAEAKNQAQAVAAAMGVGITGVYSVTVSVSAQDVYPEVTGCVVPPMPSAPDPANKTTAAPTDAPKGTPLAGGANGATGAMAPPLCIQTTPPVRTSMQVWVSVTVAFSFA